MWVLAASRASNGRGRERNGRRVGAGEKVLGETAGWVRTGVPRPEAVKCVLGSESGEQIRVWLTSRGSLNESRRFSGNLRVLLERTPRRKRPSTDPCQTCRLPSMLDGTPKRFRWSTPVSFTGIRSWCVARLLRGVAQMPVGCAFQFLRVRKKAMLERRLPGISLDFLFGRAQRRGSFLVGTGERRGVRGAIRPLVNTMMERLRGGELVGSPLCVPGAGASWMHGGASIVSWKWSASEWGFRVFSNSWMRRRRAESPKRVTGTTAPALDALYPDFLSPRRPRSPCEGAGGSVQEARPPSPE